MTAGTIPVAAQARLKPTSAAAFLALLGFFVVEYTRPGIYFPLLEALHINSIIPLAAFLLALFARAGRPNAVIFRHPITKWMLFFVALFFVQFFTADVKLYVYDKLIATIGYLLIYYSIIRNVTSVERFKGLFAVLVGVHVVMLILHPNVVLEPERRHYIGGTFLGDGNDFAWSACIVAPMAFFLVRYAKSKLWRYAWLVALLLLIVAVVGTQSRGGSIALGIVALYLVLRSKRRLAGLAWLGALVGIVLLFAPAAYFERMKTVSTYQSDGSAQGRIVVWQSAMRMAEDHPLVGVGAGHFSVKFGMEYRPPGVGRRQLPWLNAHSIYFVALGEFGYSGIIFLLAVIVLGLLGTHRVVSSLARSVAPPDAEFRELALAVQCSLIGFSVAGAFLSGLYYPHLFVLCAMSVAMVLLFREAQAAPAAQRIDTGPLRESQPTSPTGAGERTRWGVPPVPPRLH